ncbi:YggT family protein [Pseudemcibacter aquimaris]|uniref:YggT family protein n=1 Tax=Pseudemcibacter aquimaris TaxID=2857064 RepID=UPI002012F6A0|nr:YggT family protein [Pseudemcibacter aquimaris]MCC3861934.1 YggT family protein [Pseudemcibacter aquimaris]WDU58686.1 YggT family protein [Pseudemcibacter aquimaris]
MGNFAFILADLVLTIASIAKFLLFVYIILSLLMSFNVINAYNQFVNMIYGSLYRLFEPALAPFRRLMGGGMGGLDFSPIILFYYWNLAPGSLLKPSFHSHKKDFS